MRYVASKKDSRLVSRNGKRVRVFDKQKIDSFDVGLLRLGNLNVESDITKAICAIFDLKGFTHFCSQTEPELFVNSFLAEFLSWLFDSIRTETIMKEDDDGYRLYHSLPFYTKFLGDGILVLWNVAGVKREAQHNIIMSMSNICFEYEDSFLPKVSKKYPDPPEMLRCGIAKGNVYSIGSGDDYVGPCINLASRLQNLPGLGFAFARKGFDPETVLRSFSEDFVMVKAAIRGLSSKEIIAIDRREYERLADNERDRYELLSE